MTLSSENKPPGNVVELHRVFAERVFAAPKSMAEQVAEVRRHLEGMGASTDAMLDALIEEPVRLAPFASKEERRIAREIQAEDEAAREEAKTAQASAPLRVAKEMPALE